MKINKKNTNLRIISGHFKNRRIPVINQKSLRPTTNKMRETLFNWLNTKIQNSQCLDCFSGSGALAIEAISRDAKNVTLLEININIIKKIIHTIKKLNISEIEVIHTDTLKWLKKKTYDIVFLDPPFYNIFLEKTIFLLENNMWLKNNSWIYIEKEKTRKNIYIPNNWILKKEKSTRKINYRLYIRKMHYFIEFKK
ncbi:Ribosomal RNA small subunit methyltransferase D [Buchnera aphidicola (Pemphigus populi)]